MKYMLMIYGNHDAWNAITKESIEEIVRVHKSVRGELTASGELIETNELAMVDAMVVRTNGGILSSPTVPSPKARRCSPATTSSTARTSKRAAEIAGRFAEAEFALIEVRQVTACQG